ncbi:MAG: hypothetical protein ACRDY7_13495, partial [Acidimicrobiia bacterium]
AWTGVEMLVWGGREPAGPARADGAAYDPIADRWRLLAPAPLAAVSPAASVLAAGEWVVLAGDDLVPSNRAAAYDPAADSWRLVAELPFPVTEATALWTGAEVVVLGADTTGSDPTRTRAAAWDPARDAWRMLPAAPVNGLAAAAVWTGEEIVTWDFELRSAALAPAGEPTWEPLPDLPLVLYECDPLGTAAGDLVYAEHCGQGALWYRSTRSWVRLTHPKTLSSQPHWTGNELLFWMGRFVDSADGIWRFMPSG